MKREGEGRKTQHSQGQAQSPQGNKTSTSSSRPRKYSTPLIGVNTAESMSMSGATTSSSVLPSVSPLATEPFLQRKYSQTAFGPTATPLAREDRLNSAASSNTSSSKSSTSSGKGKWRLSSIFSSSKKYDSAGYTGGVAGGNEGASQPEPEVSFSSNHFLYLELSPCSFCPFALL